VRRGFSVLAAVCMLAFAAGLVVMAYHTLWRGSSRTLFSIQEHRELANVCRSALCEAVYQAQIALEQGAPDWVDWCSLPVDVPVKTFQADVTAAHADNMTTEGTLVRYAIGTLAARRVKGLSEGAGMRGQLGLVDFSVRARVSRTSPTHTAIIKMTERRAFWFSDETTPFSRAGRHVEMLTTPVATFVETVDSLEGD
jgi:hypothetical protein